MARYLDAIRSAVQRATALLRVFSAARRDQVKNGPRRGVVPALETTLGCGRSRNTTHLPQSNRQNAAATLPQYAGGMDPIDVDCRHNSPLDCGMVGGLRGLEGNRSVVRRRP